MGEVRLITVEQEIILREFGNDPFLAQNFYFSGGTALSLHYLHHRASIDLDFFSETSFDPRTILAKVTLWAQKLKASIEYVPVEDTHIFNLRFRNTHTVKVDFALYPTAMFSTIEWDRSYKVMLDKDSLATNPKIVADGVRHNPPTETEVVNVIREFWFEAYHVAKYLKRDELWLVKSRDWATKELLLKMIEWHAQANHRWAYDTKYMGKHLKVWADAGTWEALHRAFAHFDSADSWRGLLATMNLFRQLAIETSEVLGFTYPQDVDQKITGFIVRLQER